MKLMFATKLKRCCNPLTLWDIVVARCQNVDAPLDLVGNLGAGQHAQPNRGQFQRQGHAIHQAADADDCRRVILGLAIRHRPSCALQKELRGVRSGEAFRFWRQRQCSSGTVLLRSVSINRKDAKNAKEFVWYSLRSLWWFLPVSPHKLAKSIDGWRRPVLLWTKELNALRHGRASRRSNGRCANTPSLD